DTSEGSDYVGRVEPPPKSRFPNHEIALLLKKINQGHDRHHFEERRMLVPRKLTEQTLQPYDEPDDVLLADQLPVYLNSFAEGHEMRRGEKRDTQPGFLIDALEHSARRALAVGAGDVDEAKPLLRIASERSEFQCIGEAELGAEGSEAIKKLNGLGIGHL